jgi:hypothetical protein
MAADTRAAPIDGYLAIRSVGDCGDARGRTNAPVSTALGGDDGGVRVIHADRGADAIADAIDRK